MCQDNSIICFFSKLNVNRPETSWKINYTTVETRTFSELLLLALEQTDNFKPQATGTEPVHMPNTTPCEMYTFLGIVYVRQFTGLTRRTHQHNVKQISKIEAYERKTIKWN